MASERHKNGESEADNAENSVEDGKEIIDGIQRSCRNIKGRKA